MKILLFIVCFMLVQQLYFIGMFYQKKKAPLNNPDYFKIYWTAFIMLALVGLSTLFYINNQPSIYLMLMYPLYSFIVYRLMYKLFVSQFKRDPVVAIRTYSKRLKWDRLFGLCFLALITIVPFGLLLIIFPELN